MSTDRIARRMPSPWQVQDPAARDCLQALSDTVETMAGLRSGDWDRRAILVRDGKSIGLVGVDRNRLYTALTSGTATGVSRFSPGAGSTPVAYTVRFTFDSAIGTNAAIGVHGMSLHLPANARVTRAWYEVPDTFTSATDAATIAVGFTADDEDAMVVAVAISDAANPWDAGLHEAIQDGAAANFSMLTTATNEVSVTVGGGEVLTAGKFIMVLEYAVIE